jgi:hypothetical protein
MAKLTRQNWAPPRAILGGSPAGESNLDIAGLEVTGRAFPLMGAKGKSIPTAARLAPAPRFTPCP